MQLGMAATDTTLFCAAKARRVLNQLHIDLGQIGQLLDQGTDALLDTGADVVDLPGCTVFKQ